MIRTGGTSALLWEPGTGKTAATIDFLGVLTLVRARKAQPETRVLVACPLAAVDTWVSQMPKWASPQIGFWAEALGGTLLHRAEALAARGGKPFARSLGGSKAGSRAGRARTSSGAPRTLHLEKTRALSYTHDLVVPADEKHPRLVVEVLNLDTFSSRVAVGSRTMADVLLDAVTRFDPEVVIVDEVHRIKGVSSNVSRVMARIGRKVPRRIILTGTVMPHSPLDVWAQWRFLDPTAFAIRLRDGTFHPLSFQMFQDRYAKMGGWMGKQVVGFRRLEEMQEVMSERASVVRKADALDLPKTTDVIVPVTLSGPEQQAYGDMVKTMIAQLGTSQVVAKGQLAQMMRLRQITAGAIGQGSGMVKSSKVQVIKSLVQDTLADETRVVVFALFREEIRAIASALTAKGTEVQVITGDTSVEDRMAMRKRFKSDDPARLVMVCQIRTMSLAVNELVTASHAVFATLPQQRDDLVQARDRLNRLGQTKPVTFWYTVAPGTVDEVVMTTHQQRGSLETAMLNHVRSYRT